MRPTLNFRGLSLALMALAAALEGASAAWFDRVAPLLTPAERKLYTSLTLAERLDFEEHFWSNKAITADEYFNRLQYIDTTFGSGKTGSGANTDQGTVYLSIGPPTRVTRFPSSRIFVPLEIWYYDIVPGVLNTELRLIFYRQNSVGFPRLYSPGVDTVRALLLPQASNVHMFGPNDSTNESDMRQVLRVPPSEDEVISAAANVATGVKYSGNMEILGRITSPLAMLGKPLKADVQSRLVASRGKLDVVQTPSNYGGSQVDLRLETTVTRELNLEVQDGDVTVYQNQLRLNSAKPGPVQYTHRLDLLPGTYRMIFTVDGVPNPYVVEVKENSGLGEIFRADEADPGARDRTPFEFHGRHLNLNPEGKVAFAPLVQAEKVNWRIRRGWEVVWKSVSEPSQLASVTLPVTGLPPGTYVLEAMTETASRSADFVVRRDGQPNSIASAATVVSFNANLAPPIRYTFAAHQWLLRGNVEQARKSLEASLALGATEEAQIELARLDAFTGNLDAGRDRVRRVLAAKPDHFEALAVYAYIETRLQDYVVAAELYRHALAVQDSPALRLALEKLPRQ